jgi:hypothetical protein
MLKPTPRLVSFWAFEELPVALPEAPESPLEMLPEIMTKS